MVLDLLNTSPFKCSSLLSTSITIKPTFPRRTNKNCRYIFLIKDIKLLSVQPGFRDEHLKEEESTFGWTWRFTTFPSETFVSMSQVADFGLQLPGSWSDIEAGPLTQRASRDWRKRQTTPDWQVADLISMGTYIQGLSWAATKWYLCQNLKSLQRL